MDFERDIPADPIDMDNVCDDTELVGQKFGRLTVVKRAGSTSAKKKLWLCICDCGNERRIPTGDLRCGKIVSCGCFKKEMAASIKLRHGQAKAGNETREYKSWKHMINRCFNKNEKAFKHYGGRGITVCDRWLEFENFYADMGNVPDGFSIERVDVNGNYEISNCKWIPKNRQATNRRSSVLTESDVREIRRLRSDGLIMKDIGSRFGASVQLVYQVLSGKAWGWVK